MARRNVYYYLIKLNRLSGWVLLVVVLGYLVTSFAYCGRFGFSRVLPPELARTIHTWDVLFWPLVAAFPVHSIIAVYFALRRWGWIKKQTKKT
jgi:succinate dehydrogenase/fumarate reductase cytochrome b subunit